MKRIFALLVGFITVLVFLPLTTTAQTGWGADRFSSFGANLTGGGSLNLGWTTGNAGNTWQEGEWPAYQLKLKNVDLSNTGFDDIIIEFDFTKSSARFADLIRNMQIGTTERADSMAWPMSNGFAYPMNDTIELDIAQKNQGITAGVEHTWDGFALFALPDSQINRGPTGGIGTVTDAKHRIILKRADILAALNSKGIDTSLSSYTIYFNLHLSQTFVWQFSLQSGLDAFPTDSWGGYLYASAPYLTDSRLGSSNVPGSSGHVNLTYGNRTAPIPIPPAPQGLMSGTKWHDYNYNGVQDGGEPVLQDWIIKATVYIGGVPIVFSDTTDASGNYSFMNFPNGEYLVSEIAQGLPVPGAPQIPPSTWGQSYPDTTSSVGVAVGDTTPVAGILAGLAPYSWKVDLRFSPNQSDLDFGNGVPAPVCLATPASLKPCEFDTATFTVMRVAQGTPPYTYAWSGPNSFSATTPVINIIAGASTAGVYFAVITDSNGLASDTCSVILDYFPLPTVSVNSDTICFGDLTTLTATTNAASPSYLWSPGGAVTASITVSPATTTVYTVTVTDGVTGCDNSAQGTVTVNQLPVCSIVPIEVCPGELAVHTGSPGMASYSWSISGPGGAISGATNLQTVTVQAANSCSDTYTLTLSITDSNGCSNSCQAIIAVQDTTLPTITCPADITVACATDVPAADTSLVSATDNCGGVPLKQFIGDVISNRICAHKYTITRTYSATDACNNVATCEQTITVMDSIPPSITCPAGITVNCASDVPAPNISLVTTSDNCSGAVTVTWEGDVISNRICAHKYTITRTYKAMDVCGNFATCTQTITVNDNVPPRITCPPAVTVACAENVPTPDTTIVTATDNCVGFVLIEFVDDVISNRICAHKYTITRTYKATDVCGNFATCTQTITVNDNVPPRITCPPAVTVACAEDVATPDTTIVTATDNCAGFVLIEFVDDVISNRICAHKYTITRTYKATDVCDNSSTCTQTITVNDNVPPRITCPPAVTVACAENVPAPDTTIVSATDNCAGFVLIEFVNDVISNRICAHKYTITRTYKATDVCDNSSTCTQTITVNDNVPPRITCPPAVTVACAENVPAPDTTIVTATDNCVGFVLIEFVDDVITNRICAHKYTITRTYKATDVCDNSSTCTQIITVNDTIPPVITCPRPITVACAENVPAPDTTIVTATDNCVGFVLIEFVDDVISNRICAHKYTITRTYKATDVCLNTSTCTQIITVNDSIPPVITCPAPVTVACAENVPAPDTTIVTATDNCVGFILIEFVDDVISNRICAHKYTITRTYKATDVCLNSSTCTQTIIVNDTIPPVITCPRPITVACAENVPGADTTTVIATDNCAGFVLIEFINDVITNRICEHKYTITRTYKATDVCDNSSTCTQTIIVNDTIPPVITCPAAITVACAENVPAPDTTIVTATDNCVGFVLIEFVDDVITNRICEHKYTITRTYKATDVCDNSSTCTQIITVNDNVPPRITCPPAVTVACAENVPAPDTTIVTATDNCVGFVLIEFVDDVISSRICAHKYTITRTYKATDVCLNTSTCTQIITVNDSIPPVITCPAPVTVACAENVPAPDTTIVTATDNCVGFVLIEFVDDVISNRICAHKYTITRTYKATDVCGNFATCTQTITVNDNVPPRITCPPAVTVACAENVPTPDTTIVTATDNCVGFVLIEFVDDVISNRICAHKYTITRTYKATDLCGNFATCTQTITVNDNVPPRITCPPAVTVACAEDVATPDTTIVTATDNCAGFVLIEFVGDVISNRICAHKYTITRTYKATDVCLNTSTCTQIITVNDTIPPSFTFVPADSTIDCPATPSFGTPVAIDNCAGAPTITRVGSDVLVNGRCAQEYTFTRSWKAVDICGNESPTVSQTITVQDTTGPIISAGDTIFIACGDTVYFDDPVYSDACDPNPTLLIVRTDTIPGPNPGQITYIRTWYAVDACGNQSLRASQVVIEERCQFQSLTQGFYGNAGGTWCGDTSMGTQSLIAQLLAPGPLVLGLPARSLTITIVDAACIIQRLPSAGKEAILPLGASVFGTNCSLPAGIRLKKGRIRNNLLTQAITMGLNLRLDSGFVTDMYLPPPSTPYLRTTEADYVNRICADGDDVPDTTDAYFEIPVSVLTAMGSNGSNMTVADLALFADTALGGGPIGPATLGDVTKALDAFNKGFDKARFFSGYFILPPPKTSRNESVPVPDGFVLFENHPNPFNPSTTISFYLQEASTVKLIIRNSLGEIVMTLVDDYKAEGYHSAIWHSTSSSGVVMPSGVYTYELLGEASSGTTFRQIRKMILMK